MRTQAVLLVSLVSPPHDAAKEHLGARKIRKLQLGFVVDVFFGGGIRLLMLLELVCGFCVWWNLVLGFVDVIFGRSLYILFGSIPHKRVN